MKSIQLQFDSNNVKGGQTVINIDNSVISLLIPQTAEVNTSSSQEETGEREIIIRFSWTENK